MNTHKPLLCYDDIIFALQRHGGISAYWGKVTIVVAELAEKFDVQRTGKGGALKYLRRYLPIFTLARVFHSSYFRFNLNPFTQNVVTIYDFMYELGYLKTKGALINILQKKAAIWQADVIICISENTKQDLLKIYPNLCRGKKIEVIYLDSALSNVPDVYSDNFNLEEVIGDSPYILFVGKRSSYKNFDLLAEAFSESILSEQNFKLFCVGDSFSEGEQKRLFDLGILDQVVSFQNVDDVGLKLLYSKAFALIYPSLYEGFGVPLLEAMKCGCPVVASNTSSIPEVVKNAGILVNPKDYNSIRIALEKLLTPSVRENYIQLGYQRAKDFSWDKTVQQHMAIYESLI